MREEAICIQSLNMFKCSQSGINSVLRCFDVKNAFYTIPHSLFGDLWYSRCSNDTLKTLYEQIFENQACLVHCSDGDLWVAPGSGVPPGFFSSTEAFNHCYDHVLQPYYRETENTTNMLRVVSSVNYTIRLSTLPIRSLWTT